MAGPATLPTMKKPTAVPRTTYQEVSTQSNRQTYTGRKIQVQKCLPKSSAQKP